MWEKLHELIKIERVPLRTITYMGDYLIAIFYLIPNETFVREYKISKTEIIQLISKDNF